MKNKRIISLINGVKLGYTIWEIVLKMNLNRRRGPLIQEVDAVIEVVIMELIWPYNVFRKLIN